MKQHKWKIIIPVGILALLAVVYAAGVIVFGHYLFPHSFISNYTGKHDVGFKAGTDVDPVLKMDDSCIVTVNRPDKEVVSFSLEEIRSDSAKPLTADDLLQSQNVFAWPAEVLKAEHLYECGRYPVDDDRLDAVLSAADFYAGQPSRDAYLTVSDDGEFAIEKEVYGTEIARRKVLDAIEEQIRKGKTEFLVTDAMYIKPEITAESKSLKKKLKKIRKRVGRDITIDLSGASEVISAGYFYDKDMILQKGKFQLLPDRVDEYVAYLDDTYSTLGKQRCFINHKGKEIKVGASDNKVPDTYGYKMNTEATRTALTEALNDKNSTEVEAVWDNVGNGRYEVNGDIGDTYIEVSIKKQHLWFYKNGELVVDADVVTGLPTEAKRTPKGIYTMFWKDTNTRLRGRMGNESWDVRVDYWLSVTYTGVGIHTAPWQPSFGGDAYTYRGSHGCINVAYETGKKLYENVDVNTVVVIY